MFQRHQNIYIYIKMWLHVSALHGHLQAIHYKNEIHCTVRLSIVFHPIFFVMQLHGSTNKHKLCTVLQDISSFLTFMRQFSPAYIR
jgi:hypothetical protein